MLDVPFPEAANPKVQNDQLPQADQRLLSVLCCLLCCLVRVDDVLPHYSLPLTLCIRLDGLSMASAGVTTGSIPESRESVGAGNRNSGRKT